MPSKATAESRPDRLLLRGILINACLGLFKLFGGIWGHSQALVADAAESLLDTFSSAIAWTGFRFAATPPDANHPYGHGKAEALVSFTIALIVYATAGFIAYSSIETLRDPLPHASPQWWTLLVLVVIVVAKFFYSRRVARASRVERSTLLHTESWHHLADAITSAVAFIGILIAVVGGREWDNADEWAALFTCVIIAANGTQILLHALVDIMDAAPPAEFEKEVRALALTVPDALDIHKCRIRKSGSAYFVEIQVIVNGDLTVRRGHAIAHAVKDLLVKSPMRIADVTVHIEPPKGCGRC